MQIESVQEYVLIKNEIEKKDIQQLKLLTTLKCLYSQQLSRMPRQYIVKLLYDGRHQSIIIKKNNKIIAGVTFRGFKQKNFYQIAFLAVDNTNRTKGLGTQLINLLKRACQGNKKQYIYTHADNGAIGFFQKMGFTENITLPKNQFKKYLLQYNESRLMECRVQQNQNYDREKTILFSAKNSLLNIEKRLSNYPTFYDMKASSQILKSKFKGQKDSTQQLAKYIPGLLQFGYNQDNLNHKDNLMHYAHLVYCQNFLSLVNQKSNLLFDSNLSVGSQTSLMEVTKLKQKLKRFLTFLQTLEIKLMERQYVLKSEFIKQFKGKYKQIFTQKLTQNDKQFIKKIQSLIYDFQNSQLKIKFKQKKPVIQKFQQSSRSKK